MSVFSYITGSNYKVIPGSSPEKYAIKKGSAFRNEPYSFQLVFTSDETKVAFHPVYELNFDKELLSVFTVGFVPVTNVSFKGVFGSFTGTQAGIYPDILFRHKGINEIGTFRKKYNVPPFYFEYKEDRMANAGASCPQALWFTFNENGKDLKPGDYKINIKLRLRETDELLSENNFTIHIIDEMLPKQKTAYTNWMHYDVLCDTYNVKMFSERHFDIVFSYVENAVLHGMNTLYTPFFTPALDTAQGLYRKEAQLVKVIKNGDKYDFDFSLAEKFVDRALKCGIEYIEHAQLFSQWGAYNAPKVVAYVNGKKKQIFGWETDASGDEYISFVKQYLTALRKFAKKKGILDKLIMHISDEPASADPEMKGYITAYEKIKKELSYFTYADTLSEYENFTKTSIQVPIVRTASVPDYAKHCDNFWFYYTGGLLVNNQTNRLITTTSERERILGVQMYYYGAKGFLHWGYNYYYDLLSLGLFNPFCEPCGYETHPGTSYLVYPGFDGKPIPSLREKIMMEAMCDIRALELLESKIGKEKTKKFIEDCFGKMSVEMSEKQMNKLPSFREKLNKEIEKIK